MPPFCCKITSWILLTCAPHNFMWTVAIGELVGKDPNTTVRESQQWLFFKCSGWAITWAISPTDCTVLRRSVWERVRTKVLLFRSIFPANGPHVVPTGSCCRLWILRSPSFWTTSSSPANKENKQCLEHFHSCPDNSHLRFHCCRVWRTPGMSVNYSCLKKQPIRSSCKRKTNFFLAVIFKCGLESPCSFLYCVKTCSTVWRHFYSEEWFQESS